MSGVITRRSLVTKLVNEPPLAFTLQATVTLKAAQFDTSEATLAASMDYFHLVFSPAPRS